MLNPDILGILRNSSSFSLSRGKIRQKLETQRKIFKEIPLVEKYQEIEELVGTMEGDSFIHRNSCLTSRERKLLRALESNLSLSENVNLRKLFENEREPYRVIQEKVALPLREIITIIIGLEGLPLWANAYGEGPVGVVWQDIEGKKYFTPLKEDDYFSSYDNISSVSSSAIINQPLAFDKNSISSAIFPYTLKEKDLRGFSSCGLYPIFNTPAGPVIQKYRTTLLTDSRLYRARMTYVLALIFDYEEINPVQFYLEDEEDILYISTVESYFGDSLEDVLGPTKAAKLENVLDLYNISSIDSYEEFVGLFGKAFVEADLFRLFFDYCLSSHVLRNIRIAKQKDGSYQIRWIDYDKSFVPLTSAKDLFRNYLIGHLPYLRKYTDNLFVKIIETKDKLIEESVSQVCIEEAGKIITDRIYSSNSVDPEIVVVQLMEKMWELRDISIRAIKERRDIFRKCYFVSSSPVNSRQKRIREADAEPTGAYFDSIANQLLHQSRDPLFRSPLKSTEIQSREFIRRHLPDYTISTTNQPASRFGYNSITVVGSGYQFASSPVDTPGMPRAFIYPYSNVLIFTRLNPKEFYSLERDGKRIIIDGPKGLPLRVKETEDSRYWSVVVDSGLSEVNRDLHTDIVGEVMYLASRRTRGVVLDWGCGSGRALREVAWNLYREGLSNVDLFGLSNMFFSDWHRYGSPLKITYILDTENNLPIYFKKRKISIIYSHFGIHNLFRKGSFYKHLKQISHLLNSGGIIIHNGFNRRIRIPPDILEIYRISFCFEGVIKWIKDRASSSVDTHSGDTVFLFECKGIERIPMEGWRYPFSAYVYRRLNTNSLSTSLIHFASSNTASSPWNQRAQMLSDLDAHDLIRDLSRVIGGQEPITYKPFIVDGKEYSFESDYNEHALVKQERCKIFRLGSLIFIPINQTYRWTMIRHIKTLKQKFGSLYSENAGNIYFVRPSVFHNVKAMPVSIYTLSAAAVMFAYQNVLKDAYVVDMGAGDGLLSRIALGLGARYVVLVEKGSIINQAILFLEQDGYREGEDFTLIKQDFTKPDFEYSVVKLGLPKRTEVVLAQIGPWPFWGRANQVAVEIACSWPGVRLFINGGYWMKSREHDSEYNVNFHLLIDRFPVIKEFCDPYGVSRTLIASSSASSPATDRQKITLEQVRAARLDYEFVLITKEFVNFICELEATLSDLFMPTSSKMTDVVDQELLHCQHILNSYIGVTGALEFLKGLRPGNTARRRLIIRRVGILQRALSDYLNMLKTESVNMTIGFMKRILAFAGASGVDEEKLFSEELLAMVFKNRLAHLTLAAIGDNLILPTSGFRDVTIAIGELAYLVKNADQLLLQLNNLPQPKEVAIALRFANLANQASIFLSDIGIYANELMLLDRYRGVVYVLVGIFDEGGQRFRLTQTFSIYESADNSGQKIDLFTVLTQELDRMRPLTFILADISDLSQLYQMDGFLLVEQVRKNVFIPSIVQQKIDSGAASPVEASVAA
ncbi:MAG: hypothetical protein NC908_04065, partial [Candidatus Omnitrophica bacterium]|nr:hypothetical protein [Candidatus Omnitrophota bacterium]